MSDRADQSAPEIVNPLSSFKMLSKKYEDFALGGTSVREFWENEASGGLCRILLHLSSNHRTIGISDLDKDRIDNVIYMVPPKLSSFDTAYDLGQKAEQERIEADIRRLYDQAIKILREKLLKNERASAQWGSVKTASPEKQDQIVKIILRCLQTFDSISLIDSSAKICMLESDPIAIKSNSFNGLGHARDLHRDYAALSREVDRFLPPEKWNKIKRDKAQEFSKTINSQIGDVFDCFHNFANEKEGELLLEIGQLKDDYQQYCEIVISEILSAKEES